MAKYTKKDIEMLAKEIFAWAGRHRLGKDFGIFYNGKMVHWQYAQQKNLEWDYKKEVVENVNPLDYCEWFPERFIAGMCYDGRMYECINGYEGNAYEKLEKILSGYDLYLEHCDNCHCVFAPIDDIEDYEYTEFTKEKPVWLYRLDRDAFERKCKEIAATCTTRTCGTLLCGDSDDGWKTYQNLVMKMMGNTPLGDIPDMNIASVMYRQYNLAKEVGDVGACTIGEYIEFRYKGKLYRMGMQTPYQGDYSWRATIPEVKRLLEVFGATEIYVNYGRLD